MNHPNVPKNGYTGPHTSNNDVDRVHLEGFKTPHTKEAEGRKSCCPHPTGNGAFRRAAGREQSHLHPLWSLGGRGKPLNNSDRNMRVSEASRPMTHSRMLTRLLLVTLFIGLFVVAVGTLSTASALGVNANLGNGDLDARLDPGVQVPPQDVGSTVDGVKNDVTGLVRDTTGIDADNLGAVPDDATGLLEDPEGSTGTGTTTSSREAPAPMTPEDKATVGVLAVASGAGLLFWLHNVLSIGLGRLFMTPLFSRIDKDELLDNEGRDVLLTLVDENPGIGLKDLSERAGLGWGTTVYHMSRLESAGYVASMKNGQNRHFFKNGHPAALMKKHVAVLRNETAGNVARFLLATPGSTQSTIAKRLGLGAPTVTKYVKRMERQGLVQVIQDGRSKIVQPTVALQDALDHAAPMPAAPRPASFMPERAAVGVA